MRVGLGFDIHRLVPVVEEHHLVMGGIRIPAFYRLEAHSDGDVLLHSLTDAVLGALALGDIGCWFPDSDPANHKRSSGFFLSAALEEASRLGWRVVQVDSNVFLEEPMLAPYADTIRRHLATLLKIELSDVSVKAKTMERLGPIGERRAVAAEAIVMLGRSSGR